MPVAVLDEGLPVPEFVEDPVEDVLDPVVVALEAPEPDPEEPVLEAPEPPD